jgi:predicted phage baseplate assembly protein
MTFQCRGESGLFGPRRDVAKGARWAIGIRAAPPLGGAIAGAEVPPSFPSPLTATLVAGQDRVPLAIASDSTGGLLATGALLLDLDAVPSSPQELTLELQSAAGFPRPPRLLQIDPSVLPVEQGRSIVRELHVSNGMPDWSFDLGVPGLRFEGQMPVRVEVAESTGLRTWDWCNRLSDRGPEDRVYEFDPAAGRVTFGNGLNGAVPPAESQVLASYGVSDGEEGNVARSRRWQVAGFEGAFGVNLDPVAGGAAPLGWIDQRREARRRTREEHPLVSEDDIVAAAKALPMLEAARGWILPPLDSAPRTGVVSLVAMRARPSDEEPAQAPETPRWLEAVRRRLAGRMPLGTRLAVSAPRYVDFTVAAKLEAHARLDPAVVRAEVVKALRRRLALVETADGTPPRRLGMPVSRRDVIAWMSAVEGVRRVVETRLFSRDGLDLGDEIAVPRGGLPRCDLASSQIAVNRPAPGSVP